MPFLLFLFLALTNSVFATEQKRQLRILTSMSERVYGPYVLEFEKLYPDIDVLVLNKNTNHPLGQIDAMAADSFGCAFAYHQNGFGTLRTRTELANCLLNHLVNLTGSFLVSRKRFRQNHLLDFQSWFAKVAIALHFYSSCVSYMKT